MTARTYGSKSMLQQNLKITIACVHRYPKNNLTEFQNAFCKNIKSSKSQKYVVLSDINIDYNMYNCATKIKQYRYVDSVTGLNCAQILTVPTRIATTRQSPLDHIYINGNWTKKILIL